MKHAIPDEDTTVRLKSHEGPSIASLANQERPPLPDPHFLHPAEPYGLTLFDALLVVLVLVLLKPPPVGPPVTENAPVSANWGPMA